MKKYIFLIVSLFVVFMYFINKEKNVDKTFLKIESNFSGSKISKNKETIILVVDLDCSSCITEIQKAYNNKSIFKRYNVLISAKNITAIKKLCLEKHIEINTFNFIENKTTNDLLNSGVSVNYTSLFKVQNNKFIKIDKL